MRGTLFLYIIGQTHVGITPAHAGNTSFFPELDLDDWDHPRTCGEHRHCVQALDPNTGSPPHMRGTPIRKYIEPIIIRITPAHAGNTSKIIGF